MRADCSATPGPSRIADGRHGTEFSLSGTVSPTNTGVFFDWNTINDTAAYSSGTCHFNAWIPSTSMFIAGGGVALSQGTSGVPEPPRYGTG